MNFTRFSFFIVLFFTLENIQAASKLPVPLQAPKSIDNWVVVDSSLDWDEADVPLIAYVGTAFPTLSSWSDSCKKQPQNRKGADFSKHSGFQMLGNKTEQWKEFESVLMQWLEMKQKGSLSQQDLWQDSNIGKMPEAKFFDVTQSGFFIPFAQKIIAQPLDEFYIRGDLHGDIYSLLIQLETMRDAKILDDSFKILKNNVRIVFLGDYVDRGQYGCEVLYTMLRLSLENPNRVIFVRGNHEDIDLSARYGFKDEVRVKFDDDASGTKHKMISRMNDFLPVVLYVGCKDTFKYRFASNQITNYLQCCHGGLEVGYDPKSFLDNTNTVYQMIGALNRATFVKEFHADCDKSLARKSPASQVIREWWDSVASHKKDNVELAGPMGLGLMWNDFDVQNTRQVSTGRAIIYGKQATEKILELQSSDTSKICGVFRGHQHGEPDMMKSLKDCKGVYKLWSVLESKITPDFRTIHNGKVWTFNVGPDSVFGEHFKFNFDAYARLIVDQKLLNWKLQVFNTNVVT